MRRISAALFALLLPVLAAAHGGMREIKGTIVKVGRDTLVVKRVDGKNESVPLSAATTYKVGDAKGNGATCAPVLESWSTSAATGRRLKFTSRRSSAGFQPATSHLTLANRSTSCR